MIHKSGVKKEYNYGKYAHTCSACVLIINAYICRATSAGLSIQSNRLKRTGSAMLRILLQAE